VRLAGSLDGNHHLYDLLQIIGIGGEKILEERTLNIELLTVWQQFSSHLTI